MSAHCSADIWQRYFKLRVIEMATILNRQSRPTVTLLLRIVPHYRVPFLERLAVRLEHAGICLKVVHGQERAGTVPRGQRIDAPWSHHIPNVYAAIGQLECVWQPGIVKCSDSDLVVVEQANRLLANYVLQMKRHYAPFRLAFWGHGKNMQSRNPLGFGERVKRSLLTRADWWFAYTDLSKQHVIQNGFPEERVTVVNNAIADDELRFGLNECQSLSRSDLRTLLGCTGEHVALFCGSFHKDKQLPFLMAAAVKVREQVPDFELLLVGDGPEASYVREIASQHPWMHVAGAVTGEARAKYFRAADLIMMPGLVGLVIVDSFVTGCPIFTTEFRFHSPEIAYLRPGINGVITHEDVNTYVQQIVTYLRDDTELAALRAGCISSAENYSLGSMVERFSHGVERCLSAGRLTLAAQRRLLQQP